MVMGSIPEQVDLAVIGAGVGGYIAAIRGAELGMSVAMVEKEKLGGHCLNYACIPSKTLIHISDIYYKALHSGKFGINAKDISIDANAMFDWRMGVSKKLEDGVEFLCKSNGIDIFKGSATFISNNSLQLTDGVTLEFKKAIIATGSMPAVMKGFEFGGNVLDYKMALMLNYIPKSIAIIGAGYVAIEIGMLYAKMGSRVSIIARSDLLSRFDKEAVELIKKRMAELDISLFKNSTPISHDSSSVTLDGGTKIDAQIIVVAIGLEPFTEGLGLENTKIRLDSKGFIPVDKTLKTAEQDIYAIGDVIGEPMLAHKAMRQGIVAAEAAAGNGATFDNMVIPAVIFSDPEVAIAGDINEREGIKISKFPLSALGRSIALNTTGGFVKMASDANGTVVGVEIVCEDANSMIGECALAIEMGANVEDIADTIHPHPTYSEAIMEAAEIALGRPIHFFMGRQR